MKKSCNKMMALLMTAALLLSLTACGASSVSASASSAASESIAAVSAAAEEAPADPAAPAKEASAPEASAAEEAASSEEAEPATAPTPVELPLTTDDVSFSVFTTVSPMISSLIDTPADITAWQELMRVTGVNLEFTAVSPDVESEQLLLMIMTGDYTDVLPNIDNNYTGGAEQAIEDNVIYDLTDYIDEYCPNYIYQLETNDLTPYCCTNSGAVGGFVKISNASYQHDCGLVIRQDMLDELGMDTPATYDDLYEVMNSMKSELGVESPLWIMSDGFLNGNWLLTGYGTNYKTVYVEDGTIRYGYAEDGMYDYLSMMHQWYEEGLIYPDFYSGDGQDACKDYDSIAANNITVFPTGAVDLGNYASYSSDPDFRVVAIPELSVNADDVIYATTPKAMASECTYVWSISTNCENVPLLCRFVDYLFTDDGSLIANYGVEGDTFEYNDAGKPVFTEKISGKEGMEYVQALLTSVLDASPYLVDWYRGTESYTDDMMEAFDIWQEGNIDYSRALPMDFSLSAEDASTYNTLIGDIDTYVEEMALKFILGYESLDQWDAYIEHLDEMGLQDALAVYQNAYDAYLNG